MDPSDSASLPCKTVAGRYELIELLGHGGGGSVFKAQDGVLDKIVAIKVLFEGYEEEDVVRFQTEAQTSARLSHKNVLTALDFGVEEGTRPYLVMDYFEGQSLAELIEIDGSLAPESALDILCQALDGLAHAHDHDVLHRDLKPSNILLKHEPDGSTRVKVVDFGLARICEVDQSLTSSGRLIGSPPYMPPEQIMSRRIDHRSDIYSIGCTLFEALSGKPPFLGESVMETLQMHRDSPPPSLDIAGNEEECRVIAPIVLKCLEKSPDNRFQSAAELRDALGGALKKLETLSDTDLEQSGASLGAEDSTRPVTVWLIVGSLLLAGAVVCLAPFLSRGSKQSSPATVRNRAVGEFSSTVTDIPEMLDDSIVWRYDTKYDYTRVSVLGIASDDELRNALNKRPVQMVNLRATRNVKGEGLRYFSDWPLKALDLSELGLSDEAFVNIARFENLERLEMSDCHSLTDSQLERLTGLKKLAYIEVSDSNFIKDNGLSALSKMKSLRTLFLTGCPGFTHEGVASLSKLPVLEDLSIGHRPATIEILEAFTSGFSKLRFLSLKGMNLSDSDMKIIARIKVRSIDLSNNKNLTYRGLMELTKSKWLQHLNMSGCPSIEPSGLKALEKRIPRCIINCSKGTYSPDEEL